MPALCLLLVRPTRRLKAGAKTRMPRITDEQARGDAGERWFVAQLPKGWFFQKPSTNVGVDGLVVVCEPGLLNGLEFRVQVETSRKFPRRGSKIVVSDLNLESVRYCFANPTPLLLVALEDSSGEAFFGWHDDAISDPRKQLSSGQSTLSAYLDTRDRVSPDGWVAIRKRLEEHYAAILRAFYESEVAAFLIPTLHKLATNVKYLVHAHLAKYWGKEERSPAQVEQAEKILILLDFSAHRDAIRTLESLCSRLERFPRQRERLADFTDQYRKAVSSFIRGFEELPADLSPDHEIQFDAERMRIVRPMLIDGLLDVIRTLSQPAKSKDEIVEGPVRGTGTGGDPGSGLTSR